MNENSKTDPLTEYKQRDISVVKIILVGVLSVLLLAVIVIAGSQYYIWHKERIYAETVLNSDSPKLIALHTREEALLTQTGRLESDPTHYRIPIARAKELVVREAQR